MADINVLFIGIEGVGAPQIAKYFYDGDLDEEYSSPIVFDFYRNGPHHLVFNYYEVSVYNLNSLRKKMEKDAKKSNAIVFVADTSDQKEFPNFFAEVASLLAVIKNRIFVFLLAHKMEYPESKENFEKFKEQSKVLEETFPNHKFELYQTSFKDEDYLDEVREELFQRLMGGFK